MRSGPAPLALGQPLLERDKVELRNAGAQRCDLAAELLRAFGSACLQRERAKALAHLLFDVPCALHLRRDPCELQLRTMLAPLEAAEPGGLLDEVAPLLGPGREDLLHPPLADDRVHRAAEAEVREQLDEIDAADRRAVDEVLALAAPVQPARDRELGIVDRPFAGGVVEQELDLAEVDGPAGTRAGVEHVVRLLGPKLRRRQGTGRPDDGVGDVGLSRAVRADHDGDAPLEANLDGLRERLEAAKADGAQVHPDGRLPTDADVG